jgi:ankyrin repeat protein
VSSHHATPSPNLEQLRKLAKELLKSARSGDSAALSRIAAHVPANPTTLKLAATQLVIARENGYSSWPKLTAARRTYGSHERLRPFEKSFSYYEDRAEGLLSAFRDGSDGVIRQIQRWHPAYSETSLDIVRAASLTVDDTRIVVALEHGYESWERFSQHIESLRRGEVSEPFADAFAAIKAGKNGEIARLLAENADIVRASGTNQTTLLNLAVSCGKQEAVLALLKAGADVDAANRYGVTPLHSAAYSDKTGLVDILLHAGARVDLDARGDGGTPLVQALFWGHLEVAQRLAEAAIVPMNLRVAAGLGRLDLVRGFFGEDGALTPDAGQHRAYYRPHPGFLPWTPSDDPQEIVDEAFVYACKTGQIPVLEFLRQHGADIDGEPYNGTGLMWAVHRGRTDTVSWLLTQGASIDRVANFGGVRDLTALQVAAWAGREDMARLLVEGGARLDIRDPDNHGLPWGWAAYHGNLNTRDYLAEAGSRTNIYYAVLGRFPDRVKELLRREPELANQFDGWATPLHEAANRGITSVARILLDHGADPTTRNLNGKTALELAVEGGFEEVATMLREYTAQV